MKHRLPIVFATLACLTLFAACPVPSQPAPSPAPSTVVGAPELSADSLTRDTTPTWSWTPVAGAVKYRIQLNRQSGAWTELTASELSWTPASPLASATHTLYAQAANDEGVWSASASRAVTVDTLPPATPVLNAATPTNDDTPTWIWTVPADAVEFRRQLDAQQADGWTSVASTTASWTPAAALSTGTHTLYVGARDQAGNWSASGSKAVIIDLGQPDPPATTFTENLSLPLAVRDYYRSAYGLSGAALKAELREILTATHSAASYDALWTMYLTTDAAPNGKVWDMYSSTSSDASTAAYWFTFGTHQDSGLGGGSEGQYFNREHTWPKSTFGSQASVAYSDGHHLVPTDKYVNNQRSNYSYGEVGATFTGYQNGSRLGAARAGLGYSGTVFEPIDIYKGDFARMHFYMALRYYGEASFTACDWANAGAKLKTWYDDMLRAWAQADPVSAKETARNTAVQAHQGNRNPFIDYPELIDLLDLEN